MTFRNAPWPRNAPWLIVGTLFLALGVFQSASSAGVQDPTKTGSKLLDDSTSAGEKQAEATPQVNEPVQENDQDKAKADKAKADESAAREAAFNELKEKKAREAARKRGEYSFDDLKFDIERGGKFDDAMLTDELKEMNKKSMRIRGYILPDSVMQTSGIKRFVLVRDNKECCFGPGAMLYDCIVVEMEEGKTADFATRPVTVKGTFLIDTKTFQYPDDGGHYAVFKLKALEVK